MIPRTTIVSVLLLVTLVGVAQSPSRPVRLQESPVLEHLRRNPMSGPARRPAEETVARMYVEDGFRAELIVAEPDLHQPIAFTFDERGRIWVVEAHSYPQKRTDGEGLDKIVIFEDQDGDGRFEHRKQFVEGLNLVSGLEIGYGGVWVGAAPELLFIPDRDHDDRPDGKAEVLLDGFGFQDTHETLNSFTWGPDGWLYGNQGVFNHSRIGKPGASDAQRIEMRAGVWRYHPVRHEFEVFAHGGSNQWGLDFDERGQLFMTYCRSYWGRGDTTHVVLGGHYWNQANQNHAPYVSGVAPPGFPFFQNFMLASARYGHGEGGSGKPGSRKIYGGHSHVGTMIYLGDNWPDAYRNHLFTHNLHGHQMNHQVNRRLGSGFDTVHAGRDVFYCEDPAYIGVDLQYGPDGAVYVIDWYERQHCHNPNTERWDRGNGRIYRIQYERNYQPVRVNLSTQTDRELVELHAHRNEWFVRTARRLLHERSLAGTIDPEALETLRGVSRNHEDAPQRLRALWTLHQVRGLTLELAADLLHDPDEYVRAWTVQCLTEDPQLSDPLARRLPELARQDPSAVVRLYLASASQRVSAALAWNLISALAQHGEDCDDRNLPLMIWYSLAQRMPHQLDRAFAVAEQTRLPVLSDFIYWYAAKLEGNGLDRVIDLFSRQTPERQRTLLAALTLALDGKPKVAMPSVWPEIAGPLYSHSDHRLRRQAETLAARFGDSSIFPRLRRTLADRNAALEERQHALAVLSHAPEAPSIPVFLALLDDPRFRAAAIRILGRFDAPNIAESFLSRYPNFPRQEQIAVLNAMTSRSSLAQPLLQAVASGRIPRTDLTAFQVRQLTQLNDRAVNQHLAENWGRIGKATAEQQLEIQRLEKTFDEAPLWAYSAGEGRKHFQLLCASCHRLKDDGNRLGPELTGAGANGVRYFLENILDPNAVIGQDYQMTVVETRDGELVSGIMESETESAVTIRTATDRVVIARSDIAQLRISELSMMPEGLLDQLKERERIELLKFLTSN